MIKIDLSGAVKFERQLRDLNARGIPYANREALNKAAFHARSLARLNVQQRMILRNKWTLGSIQVEKATGLRIDTQHAIVGSLQKYMADQEFGGIKRSKRKQGVPIATRYASGEGESGSQPRKRLPTSRNRLKNIRLRHRQGGKGRKHRNIVAIKEAAKRKRKYVYLDLGKRKGIFRVLGRRKDIRIRMVHSLQYKAVRIPANPWLKPAVDATALNMGKFYAHALRFQLGRIR